MRDTPLFSLNNHGYHFHDHLRTNLFLFVFFFRPPSAIMGIHIAYLQRQNYKKRESHLMKSEKGSSSHHTNSAKRPGH